MLLGDQFKGVSQRFNQYYDQGPTSQTTKGGWHPGIDYRAPPGTQVRSPVEGVVQSVDRKSGRVSVKIKGTEDNFIFMHLSALDAKAGQEIRVGDSIGKSGTAGSGPHVHVEVRKGREAAAWYFTSPENTGANRNPTSVLLKPKQ